MNTFDSHPARGRWETAIGRCITLLPLLLTLITSLQYTAERRNAIARNKRLGTQCFDCPDVSSFADDADRGSHRCAILTIHENLINNLKGKFDTNALGR
ncbi:hypothetical protein QYH69_16575 [Paraburkholderia sp. SARCC-3016]|uniref:hypothetical protein n=1 Tax=Paraburkholderia sp. SARCC-3016 TaxID=3058611 RepID=UPI00280798DB|nr:hypothetical protein [Paraburkholderia sp. SARCC-3016]MDQ7978864.1 hypothetical protein [Paraburkholderia sp. SARCC-3016]